MRNAEPPPFQIYFNKKLKIANPQQANSVTIGYISTIATILTILATYTAINFFYWKFLLRFFRKANRFSEPLDDTLIRLRLGPLSQSLSFLFVLFLTILITKRPEWEIWNFIIHDDGSPSGILGKSSAAMLAVLAFTATTTANAVRDRKQGGSYFGQPLSTYLISKSYVSEILWAPVFKVITLIVFLFPFFSRLISDKKQSSLFWTIENPRLLGTSIWLSCLIVVSVALLFNMLALFRQPFILLRQPRHLLELYITEDLNEEMHKEIKSLFLKDRTTSGENSKTFHARLIKFASSLSNEKERDRYLQETIGSIEWIDWIERIFSLLEGEICNIGHSSYKVKKLPRRDGHKSYFVFLHNQSIERKLLSAHSIMRGRHEALLDSFDSRSEKMIREKMLNRMLLDAVLMSDRVQTALQNLPEPEKDILTSCRLISRIDRLPDPQANIKYISQQRFNPEHHDDPPSVITVTAMTYRDLARIIRNGSSPDNPLSQRYSSDSLRDIIDSASRIYHEPTRRYALQCLIEALIDSLIINRRPDEQIPASDLKTLVPGLNNYLNSPLIANSRDDSRNLNSLTLSIVLGCIKSHLKASGLLKPESYSELLKYVPEEEVVAALLYMLLYSYRAGRKVSAKILLPFVTALRHHIGMSDSNKQAFYEAASTVLNKSSRVSHTLNKTGLKWLFEILEDPITITMYCSHTNRRENGDIDVNFTNLVLWRALAGSRLYFGEPFIDSKQNPLEKWGIENAIRDIKDAAKILEDSGMKDVARNIRSSLPIEESPEAHQPKEPQRAASVRPLPHLHPRPTPSADRRLSNRQRRRLSRPNQ